MSIRIGFTGDVMLGRLVDERQKQRPPQAVWGTALEHLQSLDALIINLECCLSNRGQPWRRTHRPFHFRADPNWSIPALEAAGVDVCALANNHVLDFETVALEDTLNHLDAARIARSGAGRTLDEALEPAMTSMGGLDIAVVSVTDNTKEYAASTDESGTAWIEFDVEREASRTRMRDALSRAAAEHPDLVVASLHWGPNMVEEPSPAFRSFARWLIDEGVDVVHGHSAHVSHGIEVIDERPVCYDMGDFVDDYAVDETLRNDRSFLFVLEVSEDGTPTELRLRPTEIEDCAVHEASPGAAEWARDRMRDRSAPFGTDFERHGPELVLSLDE